MVSNPKVNNRVAHVHFSHDIFSVFSNFANPIMTHAFMLYESCFGELFSIVKVFSLFPHSTTDLGSR